MLRHHLRGPSAFLALLLPVALLAIAGGCGGGSSDDGGDDPLPSTKIDVHEFSFDTAARTYEVLGEIIPEDDVAARPRRLALLEVPRRHGGRAQGLGALQDSPAGPSASCSPAAARTACSTAPAACPRRRA